MKHKMLPYVKFFGLSINILLRLFFARFQQLSSKNGSSHSGETLQQVESFLRTSWEKIWINFGATKGKSKSSNLLQNYPKFTLILLPKHFKQIWGIFEVIICLF